MVWEHVNDYKYLNYNLEETNVGELFTKPNAKKAYKPIYLFLK